MPAHAPNRLIALLLEPLVAKILRVEVVNFKGAVMDMSGLGLV